MKRWLVGVFFLAGCGPQPSPPPPDPPSAHAAAIPEGRTPEQRRELFRAALQLYDRGEIAASEPLFQRVSTVYPELADYATRYLAKAAGARGDGASALLRWQYLASAHPDSIWIGEAQLALGRARAQIGDWASAASLLELARAHLADAQDRAEALALSARAARELGNVAGERALIIDLRTRHPQSAEAVAAREEAWEHRDSTALRDARSARDEANLLLVEGVPSRALDLLREAESKFDSEEELPAILWLEANALAKLGEQDAATALMSRVLARYPRHPAAAQALYRTASLAWNRDDDDEALSLFRRYAQAYPRGDQVAEALYAAGRIEQEDRRYAAAARHFADVARTYPRHALAAESRFRVGWCWYRLGDRPGAVRAFSEVAQNSSGMERAAALYWRARVQESAEGYRSVILEFPESYYATLAEGRLGEADGAALRIRLPAAASLPDMSSAASCAGGSPTHRARFGELKAMGLRDFARRELSAYQQDVSGCDEFLISAWVAVDGYRQSVGRAQKAGGCGIGSALLRYCYPLGYWPVLERRISEHSLDPFLVAALIRQESLFDAQIRSSANAIGLMQIIPSTGKRLAAKAGLADFHDGRLLDPEANAALGTMYLRDLLDRYSGNLPRALAAYNAGEAAVDKWNRRYPDLDDDEFVESISYRETRGYVKRVLQNRRIYQALYAPSASSR